MSFVMARIVPFEAIRYSKERVQDLSLVLTPPYDVISKEEQERFYCQSPYNIIRIILGKEKEGDDLKENRYTRARGYLTRWLDEGILIRDTGPSIYAYSVGFHHQGRYLERVGFISLLELEEFGKGMVYPHERTLSKPKEDRLELLRHCLAHTEPIFLLYEDQEKEIRRRIIDEMDGEPVVDVEYGSTQRHRLWIVQNPVTIRAITDGMVGRTLYIADGHHRYEVALSFKKESSHKYIMAYMVDMEDEGLVILPAHRLVRNLSSEERRGIAERVERYFNREEMDSLEALLERLNQMETQHVFGMYERKRCSFLLLKDDGLLNRMEDTHPALRRLGVTILHNLILGMGIEEKETEERIGYTTSAIEAREMVDIGDYEIAFLLNPTKVKDVRGVARSGEPMPGKATYFYPKPLSGLLIHKF